jgi:DNA-binding transcriptional LysR family regulator
MAFESWDEVRTAFQVARIGTVSGAAEVLGVHHATVIRHIDAIEGRLGVKLFQRHPRGYTPTEAGRELLKVAEAAEDQFAQLASRINGTRADIAGELVVTSVPGLGRLVAPALLALMAEHPGLVVHYVTEMRVFRLEYGEAHVALRAGPRPQEPDYVVQPLCDLAVALYASEDYLARHGRPASEQDLAAHRFVGPEGPATRIPYFQWLAARVPAQAIIFRTNDLDAAALAVSSGRAMAFLAPFEAEAIGGLVEVLPPRPDWAGALWLVSHVDLHRTPKVKAVLAALKAHLKGGG